MGESVAQEAHRLVNGDRGQAYGPPHLDFARVGRIWGAILDVPDIPAHKVGLCLAGLKLSRESFQHKRDSLVDLAGYALTIEKIHEAER